MCIVTQTVRAADSVVYHLFISPTELLTRLTVLKYVLANMWDLGLVKKILPNLPDIKRT